MFFENKKIGTGTAGRCVCCVCGVHYVTPLLAVLERPGEELLRKVSEAVSCMSNNPACSYDNIFIAACILAL